MGVSASQRGRSPESGGPRKTAAARSRAATRERLLTSARNLFATEGLHGVTTHDIAAAAGVAAGTFYLHFKDKREVFREIAAGALAELQARLDATEPGPEVREAHVRAQSASLVDFALENRELMRILFSADSDARVVETDLLDEFAAWIAEGREEAIAAGEMPPELDSRLLSQALVGLWARVLKWWVDDPTRVSRETFIETLTRIQLGGTHPEREKS